MEPLPQATYLPLLHLKKPLETYHKYHTINGRKDKTSSAFVSERQDMSALG
jgi:hypothetical protein